MKRGLSLTEVLIAMGILTLGLLGVASVFPVASYYMQKADVSDHSSAIAQSVFNDIMARGMLNPRAWYVMIPNDTSVPAWGTILPSDGKYSPGGTAKPSTFRRPLAAALSDSIRTIGDPKIPASVTAANNIAMDKSILARQFGSAFVIDPLGVSVMAFRDGNSMPSISKFAHGPAAVFPATAYNGFGYYINYSAGWAPSSAWGPWFGGSKANFNPYEWPIRRVTFRQPSSGFQMDATMAEHYFRSSDDITVDFPARDDRPGIQNWDTAKTQGGVTVPLARKWTGDYSWIVTVSPPTEDARNGMATNPEGFAYDVSVVVFYKRGLPDNADDAYVSLGANNAAYLSAMSANERAVKANVISTGPNGGELLLTDFADVTDSGGKVVSAFDNLKNGNWIMLCGPHPDSQMPVFDSSINMWKGDPRFVLKWYQVVASDPAYPGMTGYDSAKSQRVITVRGPEWPWQPTTNATDVANDLCVAICKGAVAVHTKSMRLEAGINEVTFNNAGGTGAAGTTQFPYQP